MHERPDIPETITVHLGIPEDPAENITVPFIDYIKNVAANEIYPTWPENALRANIHAIVSNALNRTNSRYYRILGYDFDITNSPEIDQVYTPGNATYESINNIVDEIITSYISLQGDTEPLFTENCNGTTANCEGISLWGTVSLANQGLTPLEILRAYDGDNIVLNTDTPFMPIEGLVPYRPMRVGDSGDDIRNIQIRLNRISNNYTSIPKIFPATGDYTYDMRNSVMEFQRIFDLEETGEINPGTWMKILSVYDSVRRLNELSYEESLILNSDEQFPEVIELGETSNFVRILQYYLAVVAQNVGLIPDVTIDGVFDRNTQNSIRAFQRVYGLPETGTFDETTRNELYNVYLGIVSTLPDHYAGVPVAMYPGYILSYGMHGNDIRMLNEYLSKLSTVYNGIPYVEIDNEFDFSTRNGVIAAQRLFGLNVNGFVNEYTWDEIARAYGDIIYSEYAKEGQFGGSTLSE